nr:PspC domain-containing protein [uncultured Sellimonas sp.]
MEPEKRLYRSKNDRMLCGVCAGVAEYFHIDPAIIRLGYVLFTCAGFGTGVLGYFIAAVVIPDRP